MTDPCESCASGTDCPCWSWRCGCACQRAAAPAAAGKDAAEDQAAPYWPSGCLRCGGELIEDVGRDEDQFGAPVLVRAMCGSCGWQRPTAARMFAGRR